MDNCRTCGIPNKANFHVNVIVGRDGETDDVDIYVCDEHMPARLDDGTEVGYVTVARRGDVKDWQEDEAAARSLFRFDDADSWEILEISVTPLR